SPPRSRSRHAGRHLARPSRRHGISASRQPGRAAMRPSRAGIPLMGMAQAPSPSTTRLQASAAVHRPGLLPS
ncbi:hypothetical protein Q4I28_000194, partial [Leishmania naiffi]